MFYILYNALSKSGKNQKNIENIEKLVLNDHKEIIKKNIIEIKDIHAFIETLNDDDEVAVVGGDGTMHYFADGIRNYLPVKQKIYMYAAGTGNDFVRNINQEPNSLVPLNEYLENLPLVELNGETSSFINGCGIGIDALVCAKVNAGHSDKKGAYASAALKSFLTYKPTNVEVEIDGEKFEFKKAWLTVVMNGPCQGGGLLFAPDQKIGSDQVSVMLLHKCPRLKVFLIFAFLVFGGKHLRFKKNVFIKTGKDVKFKHSEFRDFQYDGETVPNVMEAHIYTTKK